MKKRVIFLFLIFNSFLLFAQGGIEFQSTDFVKESIAMLVQSLVNTSYIDSIDLNTCQVVEVDKNNLLDKYSTLINYSDDDIEREYKNLIINLLNSSDADNNYYDKETNKINIDLVYDNLSIEIPDLYESILIVNSIFAFSSFISKEDFIEKDIAFLFKEDFKSEYDLFRYISKVLYDKLEKDNFILNIYPLVYIKLEKSH